ncbi:MAG: succinate dehydrogenase assembly factor 2 [Gammaproteobacteria bacterium]|nr:succinate dehydrogenase assembly factor 2 [Gammaproteobacteria bacterium]
MEISRLRWRCRRGLAELDELLGNFLDRGYVDLNSTQQQCFEQLLTESDNELLDYLMLKTVSKDGETNDVIGKIRAALTS